MILDNKRLYAVISCVITAVVLCWVLIGHRDTKAQQQRVVEKRELNAKTGKAQDAKTGKAQDAAAKNAAAKVSGKTHAKGSDARTNEVDATDMSFITKDLDNFLDDDNFAGVLREAARLKKNPNPEVRSRVAFALNWTGVKGLAELTSMLGDPDPDVASEAMTYWKMELADVESSADKAALLTAAVDALGPEMDADVFSDLLMEFTMLDEIDAVPNLVELLNRTNDPGQSREIIDTTASIINSDQPMDTKDKVNRAFQLWLREKSDEMAADQAEAAE